MTFRLTIGIDPGQSGALAFLADGMVYDLIDMPTLPRAAGGMHVDERSLADSIRSVVANHSGAYVFAVLEEVGAMPKQGVTSTFRFGESYGIVRGVLGALGIAYGQVRPDRWKKHLGLSGKEKDAARTVAMQRYPLQMNVLKRKKDVGRADALLIATWAELTEQIPKQQGAQ